MGTYVEYDKINGIVVFGQSDEFDQKRKLVKEPFKGEN
jgi:hypothetical protein